MGRGAEEVELGSARRRRGVFGEIHEGDVAVVPTDVEARAVRQLVNLPVNLHGSRAADIDDPQLAVGKEELRAKLLECRHG